MEVLLLLTGHLMVCTVWVIIMFACMIFLLEGGFYNLAPFISMLARAILMIGFSSIITHQVLPMHGIETNTFAVGIMWLLVYLPAFVEGRFIDRGQGFDELSNISAQHSLNQDAGRVEEIIQFGSIIIFLLFSKGINSFFVGDGWPKVINFLFSSQIVIIILGCIGAVWLGWNWVTFILSRKR